MDGQGTGGKLNDGQQNLNDIQNYLVHFNKEIGVTGDNASFQHAVSQIVSQASQPVFVTVPVSSESTTPDEEQLPVLSTIKEGKQPTDKSIIDDEDVSDDIPPVEATLTDSPTQLIQIEEIDQTSTLVRVGQDNEMGLENQVEGLTPSITLQELRIEPNLQDQQAFTVSEGMVMLPVGDAGSILSQTDPRLVQIVNVNGQPTLQVLNDATAAAVLQHNAANAGGVQLNAGLTPSSSVVTQIDGTDPVAVLASVAANTTNVNQLQTIQFSQQDMNSAQLVALRGTVDGSQPQLVAVQMEDGIPTSVTGTSDLVISSADTTQLMYNPDINTGYQSVAIVPSGEQGDQGEVNYVLIVNQGGGRENLQQGPFYDFGGDIQGEVVEEMTDEDGTTKRLVKINQLLAKQSIDTVAALAVGDQLMCSYCNYTSPKRYLLSRHMKSHSYARPHKCTVCDRGFKTNASLQNHVNTHSGIKPHKCKLCESAFTTSGELVRHIRYKHTFEKPHKCTECDYASVELSKLKRHIRSHTGERPYACIHCNYASPDTYKLKRHMRIHTGEKPYECDICHAKFTQSNSLKAHKLIHSGNKPVFQCSLCPATCGRKTDLKIHMQKLHSSDHPLMCKKCGENFPDRYTFKLHVKSHEGEKCFRCSECDYAAISQRHLETHILTHTGMKPFECEDCDLTFRQKQLLKRHRNLYHNSSYSPFDPKSKEHECIACEKAFANRGNLVRHVQNAHNDCEQNTEQDIEVADNIDDNEISPSDVHTCGGWSKAVLDKVTPLTADQLIENSLLADMKEGKLGTSPKVVVVHPDGRVEEVTAKLQSLSQSKPVDDFLVSLGVTGDTHFDQVEGLPVDVCVSSEPVLTAIQGAVSVQSIIDEHTTGMHGSYVDISSIDTKPHPETIIVSGIPQQFQITIDETKEEGTQASFDSDDEESKKMKILGQEQLLRLAQGGTISECVDSGEEDCEFKITAVDRPLEQSIQQIMVSVLHNDHLDNRPDKRPLEDEPEQTIKRVKLQISPVENG